VDHLQLGVQIVQGAHHTVRNKSANNKFEHAITSNISTVVQGVFFPNQPLPFTLKSVNKSHTASSRSVTFIWRKLSNQPPTSIQTNNSI
jgi:hypothetical protein